MSDVEYHQVRCKECSARLFDTTADNARPGDPAVEIAIRCWRCKSVCTVHLAQAVCYTIPGDG